MSTRSAAEDVTPGRCGPGVTFPDARHLNRHPSEERSGPHQQTNLHRFPAQPCLGEVEDEVANRNQNVIGADSRSPLEAITDVRVRVELCVMGTNFVVES